MKTRNFRAFSSAIASLVLAILACNMPQSSPTPDLTLAVAQTQTAAAVNQILTTANATTQPITTAQTPSGQPPVISPTLSPANPPQQNCTDKAKFKGETIPDDSVFGPGESFVKTWTLVNAGDCTWTTDYHLVFINGDQMGGSSPSPIGQAVPPNGEIQLYLPQVAPQAPGEHQGFWKLRNTSGRDFGLGENAEVAFWVKIITLPGSEEGSGSTGSDQPTWKDTFDKPGNTFYLGKDEDISFVIETKKLVMTAFEPAGDQWRVAEKGYLENAYLEAKFKTGSDCSGKDSYGLIVRAPDSPDGIIDTGYVFGFSCEGKFRVYRMDDGNYEGIEGWTGSAEIKAGPDQKNTMGVMVKGELLQLFANGVRLYEFNDAAYAGGLFGLMIRSDVTEDFQVSVEEMAYWIIQ